MSEKIMFFIFDNKNREQKFYGTCLDIVFISKHAKDWSFMKYFFYEGSIEKF